MANKILNVALLIVVILLLLKGCEIQKDRDNLLTQMATYKNGEKQFKNRILADSSTLATQSQTILTQNEAIKLGLLKLEGEVKKVQSQVKQSQEISISDIAIPFVPNGYADTSKWIAKFKKGDTSRAICDSFIANSVIVPKDFGIKNKWYSIDGKVKKDGLQFDSLKIINESSVTIGYKKGGFLNLKLEPIVEIKNSNPYLSVSKMSNVIVTKNKSILQSKLFWMGVGIIGGIYIHTKL